MENSISISNTMVIGVGNILYSDKNVGSEFSYILKEKLCIAIQQSLKFTLSDTDNLDLLLKEMEFQHSGFVDENQLVRMGELNAVKGLLLGNYYDTGTDVSIYLKLIEVETGTIIASEEMIILKNNISASIIPDNYSDALYIINEITNISDTSNEDLIVKAWIERGNGATYVDGEDLIINFFSSTDCYIKVYHIDVDGQVQLIFPNNYYLDNYIIEGEIYRITDTQYPFTFNLGYPFGTEFIKVIASTIQFADIEESFTDIGVVTRGLLERGLTVEQREGQITELLLNYTIIE